VLLLKTSIFKLCFTSIFRLNYTCYSFWCQYLCKQHFDLFYLYTHFITLNKIILCTFECSWKIHNLLRYKTINSTNLVDKYPRIAHLTLNARLTTSPYLKNHPICNAIQEQSVCHIVTNECATVFAFYGDDIFQVSIQMKEGLNTSKF